MQNVSEEFKQAISQPSREIESRITFPDLVLDDYQVRSINLNSILVGSDDFEIGTAPMDMVKVELVEDTGDEWGRNLALDSENLDGAWGSGYLGSVITYEEVDMTEEWGFSEAYRIRVIGGTDRIKGVWYSNKGKQNLSMAFDTTYTYSLYVKNMNDKDMRLSMNGLWGSPAAEQRIPVGYNGRFITSGQRRENYDWFQCLLYTYDVNDDIDIIVGRKQVEKGPVATPWTPAPEDYANYDYENKECEIELGLTLPDEAVEYVSIGKYTVENAVRKNNTITLDCVDRMYKAEKDYVSDLMYPTTILDILESACDQAGIELATTTFANSDYIVPNEPVYEDVTCRQVFAQVAELAGGYAKINRLGQLEILTLGNESVRDITKDHYIDFRRDEVAIGKIDRVIVKVGAETAEQGTGEDIYTIVDNMFVQNPNNVVGPLYNVLKNVSYTACSLKWQGDFSLDLGDKITIDGHDTYILDRSLKYTGGLRETYRAPAKSNIEKESTGKRSLTLEMANYKSELRIVKEGLSYNIEKVEEVEDDLGDLADRLEEAELKIEPNAIVQTVRASEGYLNDLGDVETATKAYAELKAKEEVDSLEIGGRNLLKDSSEITLPNSDRPHTRRHAFSNGISELEYLGGGDLSSHGWLQGSLVDSQYADLHNESITLSVSVRTDSDGFSFGFDVRDSSHGNRVSAEAVPISNTNGNWKRVYTTIYFPDDSATRGSMLAWFRDNGNLSVGDTIEYKDFKLEKGNKATDWTPAPEDVNGTVSSLSTRMDTAEQKIAPTAIVQTVRQSTAYQGDLDDKVDINEIISSINQTAEQIKIQANKIKLEGLVTANSNFKVLTDGSIEAKNATISGIVTASSGSIGDWSINNSIYSKHGDTYTTLKGSGNVAFAAGAPDPNSTGGANLQIGHDGRIRKNSDGTLRMLIDNDRINFYDSSASLSGSIRGMLPEDEYDTSQLEVESGHVVLRSGNASIYTFQGNDIGIPPLAVMESSYPGSYGIVEVGPGGVIIEGSGGSLLVGPDGVSAFADMHLYGTIYLDDGMGTSPTIRALTSSGSQGMRIRVGDASAIYLYGEYDSNYPSGVILRSGGQVTLYLDANRNARFYGDLRVDGAITNASINASQLTGTVASARLPIRAGSFTVTVGSSTSVSFSSSLPSTVRVVANVGGSSSTDHGTLKVYNVSSSGFSATLRGGATPDTITCYYIAVGGF